MAIFGRIGVLSLAAGLAGFAGAAGAGQPGHGQPRDWQLGLQPAASTTMERLVDFHDLLLVIILSITVAVLLLLLYVM